MFSTLLQPIKNFLGFNPEDENEDLLSDIDYSDSESNFSDISDMSDVVEELPRVPSPIQQIDSDSDSDSSEEENITTAEIMAELEAIEDFDEEEEKMSELPETKGRTPSPSPSPSPVQPIIRKIVPKLPSNVVLINFSKPLPTSSSNDTWDFLTLYKALHFKLYNDSLPSKIHGTRLKRNNLTLGNTQNYRKEILDLEIKFFQRYNLLKTMEEKILSLQFLKNGQYIKVSQQLEEWKNKMLNSQYVDEMKDLKEQLVLNMELSEEEKLKLAEYNKLQENIERYDTYVIGNFVKFGIIEKKEKEKKEDLLKVLEKLNKHYKDTNGNIDSQFGIKKQKIIEKKVDIFAHTPNGFLKSKMIRHLQIFFDVNFSQAALLLKDNLFDEIIKYDAIEINQKLDLIQTELDNLDEIKQYVSHMRSKIFLCPHCSYNTEHSMNIMFHISQVHKSSQKTLMVIKPFNNRSVYDNFEGDDDKIYFHMKTNNKLINTSDINQMKKLDSDVIEKMVPYVMSSKEVDVTERKTKTDVRKLVKQTEKKSDDFDDLFGDEEESVTVELVSYKKQEQESFKESLKVKNHKLVQYLSTETQKHLENVIEQASKLQKRTLGYRWVDSILANEFAFDILKTAKMDSIQVVINGDNYNFSNVTNIPMVVTNVVVGGKILVKDSVLVGEEDKMNLSKTDLVNLIKDKIFEQKVKQFAEKLAKEISTDVDQNSNVAVFKDLFANFFDKLLHSKSKKTNVDFIFDDLVDDLNSIEDAKDLYYRLTNEKEGKKKKKSKESNADFDDLLFYFLLSFLPHDNEVVKNIYNIVEIEQFNKKNRKRDHRDIETDEFLHKNQVWKWNSFYTDKKVAKDNEKNFQMVSLEHISDKIFEDDSLKITREFTNKRMRVLKAMRLDDYKNNLAENKKQRLIKEFLINSLHRKIIDTKDFRIIMGLMLLNNFDTIYEMGKFHGKKTLNGEIILRFVKIMSLYLEKEKIYKIVKGDGRQRIPVKNRIAKTTEEANERKDDLLNDFMNITDETLELEANNPGVERVRDISDDEAELYVDIDNQDYFNVDDEPDMDAEQVFGLGDDLGMEREELVDEEEEDDN